jgi:hypothetical protein
MSFESGGDLDNPFDDENGSDDQPSDPDENTDRVDSREDNHSETTQPESAADTRDQATGAGPDSEGGSKQEASGEIDYISDLSVDQRYSPVDLARALIAPEYHSESPPVPYATWRDGTSTGRNRTTIELNRDVDDLVRKAQSEFEDRYETGITKADLREFAMVYGLAHLDDVFEMAEEWGIQYDN